MLRQPCTKYLKPTHVLPAASASSSSLLPVYARPSFVLSHGKGTYLYTKDGQKFLDFTSGIAVNSLGHAHEGFLRVMEKQASKLVHCSNVYHNEWADKLAALLIQKTKEDGGLGWKSGSSTGSGRVFFANSGAEANEGALKIARKIGQDRGGPSKHRIVCFQSAFHGRTLGALSVTPNPKYQAPFAPLIPGVDVGKVNQPLTLQNGEPLITKDTCAVIVEPIQGEGGINAAKVEWLTDLRKECDTNGAVLIFDEIQCGLYRSSCSEIWTHSSYPVNAHPDVVTIAKPLANGYPIGAILTREEVGSKMQVGIHGTTFGGSPLACALGHYVLSQLSHPNFLGSARKQSSYLQERLHQMVTWFPKVLEPQVRGRGLLLGLGFNDEKGPARAVDLARERGLLILTAGKNVVRIVPSLTLKEKDVDEACDRLEGILGVMNQELS